MNISEQLGFYWSPEVLPSIATAANPRKPSFILKKMMAEYVWDITQLEDNPYTFIEVQTLLNGVTIGGHSLQDQNQVLNQERALRRLIQLTEGEKPGFGLSKSQALELHTLVACEEALAWGEFRCGQVGIGGTSHKPPPPEILESKYDSGIKRIGTIENPVEQALVYFFWGAMNQFFFDGNKRTSRAMMNGVLMSSGYYYLTVPAAKKDQFNQVMVDFYNTKEANEAMVFLLDCYKNWD